VGKLRAQRPGNRPYPALRDDPAALDTLTLRALEWRTYLTSQEDLTTRLIRFCEKVLQTAK
jgi:hypothetical protein